MNIFSFKKYSSGYKYNISGKTAWYFFETFGFPVEMFVEEINRIKKEEPNRILNKLFIDWCEFNKNRDKKLIGINI